MKVKQKRNNLDSILSTQKNICTIPLHEKSILKKFVVFLLIGIIWGCSSQVNSQDIKQFFKQNCMSCHTIGGGRLVGPDLKNVTMRKSRDWLTTFIVNPKAVLDARDPYALKLQAEAKGVIMATIPGMNVELANKLLDLIEAQSKLESSEFVGTAVSVGSFSEADAKEGLKLFSGQVLLANEAPACISCHTVNARGSSLGGRLGPDLTTVFERLQGRVALSAWLSAPPTSTMQSLFKNKPLKEDEIRFLVSYLESVTNNTGHNYDSLIIWMTVIFCGFGGSVIGLVCFSGIWGNRFRAVRRPLVKRSNSRGAI